jgi:DNA-binding NarL/FixJ family response regulator
MQHPVATELRSATYGVRIDRRRRVGQVTTVAVLDDQPLFVDGVAMALDASPDITLVLQSTAVDHLLASLERIDADVLIMEPWGPLGDGLAGMAAVRDRHPAVAVVALSHRSGTPQVQQIVALGARAYLSKATSAADLPSIIRHVAAGATMLPPAARRRPGADLTVREVEVLGLAAQGISNAELGRLLFVSERTIKFHLRNVFLKLGATNRTEAAHVALMRGLIG